MKIGTSRTPAGVLLFIMLAVIASTCMAQVAADEGEPEIPPFGAELLRDSLEFNFNSYTHNVWGTITALLVAIGWLLTSEKSRIFLSRNSPARWAAIAATLAILAIHCLTLAEVASSSERLTGLIRADPYVNHVGLSTDYFQRFQVPWHYVVLSMVLDGTLFVLLIVLLHRIGGWSEPPSSG